MKDDDYVIIQGSGILNWLRDIPEGISRVTKPKVDISTLDPFVRQMLVLADSAYQSKLPNIGPWTTVEATDRVRVYKKDKTIVIAVRGTADRTDVLDDTLLAREKLNESPRFQSLLKLVRDVMAKYPDDRVILTGHSLGGGMIIELLEEKKSNE